MAKSKGTKRVVWCNWSANVAGRCFSGRDQFSADAYQNYLSHDSARIEKGLGHIASVIKGSLKKHGKIPKDSKVQLGYDQIRIWNPVAGPKEIPRGRSSKSLECTQRQPDATRVSSKPKKKGGVSKISPNQQKLF